MYIPAQMITTLGFHTERERETETETETEIYLIIFLIWFSLDRPSLENCTKYKNKNKTFFFLKVPAWTEVVGNC